MKMQIRDIKNIMETENSKCFVEVKLNDEWHAVPVTQEKLLEIFKRHRTDETLNAYSNPRNELYIS